MLFAAQANVNVTADAKTRCHQPTNKCSLAAPPSRRTDPGCGLTANHSQTPTTTIQMFSPCH
jgi:hypothetical protein